MLLSSCRSAVLAVIGVLAVASVAQACSCLNSPFEDKLSSATDVLRVKVVKKLPDRNNQEHYVTRVVAVYKGCHEKDDVVFLSTALNSAACGVSGISQTGTWLIMGKRGNSCCSDSAPIYTINSCDGSSFWETVPSSSLSALSKSRNNNVCASPCNGGEIPLPGEETSLCPKGQPLKDAAGQQLFCGRGPSRVDCPAGSSCVISPIDAYAVCCKN